MRHLLLKFRDWSLLLLLAIPGTVACQTAAMVTAPPPLAPDALHVKLDQTITRLLSDHYRQARLDSGRSGVVLDAYLQALDPGRSYFLARDIDAFNKKYRANLDGYLLAGNLEPAYEIFNTFQRRLSERTGWILARLQQNDFNFTVDESLELERKNAPWAGGPAELDELWRKRLKNEMLTLMLTGKDQEAARQRLIKRYDSRLKNAARYTNEDVFQLYINAVAHTFDPHTAYLTARNSENFNIQMRLSLEGIGAVLRMDDEEVTVVELVPGSPADLSGQIKPGDKIIAVGQGDKGSLTDVVAWRLDDVVELIRGPRNTVVRLQVMPAKSGPNSPVKTVRLVRDTIKLEKQAAQQEIKTFSQGGRQYKIALIDVPIFYSDFAAAQRGERDYRSTTRDVRRLLQEAKRAKVDGVVIDLRQNGGGLLQEAVELTGLFIPQGPVVQVRYSNGGVEVENDPDPGLVYDGPLAVLVDRFSASASEIFAGAIQDYGRGLVIGDPTFGKGTVQALIPLGPYLPGYKDAAGQLKLTTAKFYRISGGSTQHRGVTPDIILPSLFDPKEVGESAQEFALPWDEIKAADFSGSRRLSGLIPQLQQRHRARLTSSAAFTALQEEINAAKQARSKTAVSLLLSKRKTEWEQDQARQRERENRRRTALGLPPLQADQEIPDPDESGVKDSAKEEKQPDMLLDESARILVDMIDLLDQQGGQRTMVVNADDKARAGQ